MPVTLYGRILDTDGSRTDAVSAEEIGLYHGNQLVAQAVPYPGDSHDYILRIPLASEADEGFVVAGDVLNWRARDVDLGLVPYTVPNEAALDGEVDLALALVALDVVSANPNLGKSLSLLRGSMVSEEVPPVVRRGGNEQWVLEGWSLLDPEGEVVDSGAGNVFSQVIRADGLLRWNWCHEVRVIASSDPVGIGSFTFSSGQSGDFFPVDSLIQVTAENSDHAWFNGWTAPNQSDQPSVFVNVQPGISVIARFEQDLDEDGLPDSWEREAFGTPFARFTSAEDDFDGDGLSNMTERDLYPSSHAASTAVQHLTEVRDSGNGTILSWIPVSGLEVRIMKSGDFGRSWTPVSGWLDASHGSYEIIHEGVTSELYRVDYR